MNFKNWNILLTAILTLVLFSACNREATIDRILSKETKNKIYKDLEEEQLAARIQSVLEKDAENLSEREFLKNYYQSHGYRAVMLEKFFADEHLKLFAQELSQAPEHGLNPERFGAPAYQQLLQQVSAKDAITDLETAYQQVAQLEVATANALLKYASTLQFGALDPQKVLQRYYIELEKADSSFRNQVLASSDLKNLIDSIQPQSAAYKAMQEALKSASGDSAKTLMVNLERARWKHKDIDTATMVYVNIPAFRLDFYKDGKNGKSMKVVVGTGRNNSGKVSFSENGRLKDQPHSHETPVLASMMHSVQVNPVWNIPESIAGKEILKLVQNDRFYLSNAGIDVIQDGKVIEDPENMDWSSYSPDNLPFRFRQRPGSDNALGKIKFLFKNNSAVYLHDTPAQAAFDREVRASSHGCVRVAEPLELAELLFGKSDKFSVIKSNMESPEKQRATDIALSPQTQVVLDYKTVEWKDNKLHFHSDVYGIDRVLYSYL